MNSDLIDIYDKMVRQQHPYLPEYDGNHWCFPYLMSAGDAYFYSLREAIEEALKRQPLE